MMSERIRCQFDSRRNSSPTPRGFELGCNSIRLMVRLAG